MKAERVLVAFAVICGVLLMVVSFTPRTVRIATGPGPGQGSVGVDSVGHWHAWTLAAGAVAAVAVFAGSSASHRLIAASSALAAIAAFAVAGTRVMQHWLALTQEGALQAGYELHPAPALPVAAAAAFIGVGYAAALVALWGWPGSGTGVR